MSLSQYLPTRRLFGVQVPKASLRQPLKPSAENSRAQVPKPFGSDDAEDMEEVDKPAWWGKIRSSPNLYSLQ